VASKAVQHRYVLNSFQAVEPQPRDSHFIGRLRELGQETIEGNSVADPNILLQFLSENTHLPRSKKSNNERLHDVLNKYLRSQNGNPDDFERFTGTSRVVQVTCNRPSNWRLAATAVRFSESMRSCWVTTAEDISKSASHPGFRVRCPFELCAGLYMNSDTFPEQILTTISTHMLEKAIVLFSPVETSKACDLWEEENIQDFEELMEAKTRRLAQWNADRSGFKNNSEAQYLRERTVLLDDLQRLGDKSQRFLADLESSLQWADESSIHTKAKEDIPRDPVSKAVVDRLDRLYCNTFRGNMGRNVLIDCFGAQTDRTKRKMFIKYLDDLKELLSELLNDPKVSATFEDGCLQARGLKFARRRIYPLFFPLDGRICLPLPTVSMLEDLREYILKDPKIMLLVRGFHTCWNGDVTERRYHRSDDGWMGWGVISLMELEAMRLVRSTIGRM